MVAIGVTGHRGLSADVERYAREQFRLVLADYPPGELIGVSCIADGPDSIFADVVRELGGRLHVVVPAATYRDDLPRDHHPLYDSLLRSAYAVTRVDRMESTSEAHMRAGEKVVEVADLLLAVWDGLPAKGYGGTADVVEYARSTAVPVRVIWPEGARRD